LYFAGNLIREQGQVVVLDRLGSVRSGGKRYFPYGEEQVGSANDQQKFATYFRDGTTGLDCADQRYYSSVYGRFATTDSGSARNQEPNTFNRYAHTGNDPINNIDPTGNDYVMLWGMYGWSTPMGSGWFSFTPFLGYTPYAFQPTFFYYVPPPPPPPPVQFKPAAIDTATNDWAHNALANRLKNFGDSNCAHVLRKVIGDSTYQTNDLQDMAKNINFYDRSNLVFGRLTEDSIANNGDKTRLIDFGGGLTNISAFTITTSPLKYAPIVVNGSEFRLINSAKYTENTLLHELLHAYLRKFKPFSATLASDTSMFVYFGPYGLRGNYGTEMISSWLSMDCKSTNPSLTWWK
jgi:RHS repeat-associated protein